jgi:hypothetical protein
MTRELPPDLAVRRARAREHMRSGVTAMMMLPVTAVLGVFAMFAFGITAALVTIIVLVPQTLFALGSIAAAGVQLHRIDGERRERILPAARVIAE